MQPYVLGDVLGVGGMGSVFAAEHPERSRVAVKLLHERFAADRAMVARLEEEAAAAQRVCHRNVIRVFEHGTTSQGIPFIAMERLDGIPLGVLVQREGALPLVRIRGIGSQILAGLAAIHRSGLVHGDMKSDNILVGDDDRVTIIDFGLARPPATRPAGLDEHMLSGTPEYMAPELVRGEAITPAADLYAVGVILYEMLTGTTPFGGGSATAIFDRHLADEVVAPSLRCPERTVPVPLETVILRALDKDPTARHLHAEMFATAVERSIALGIQEPRTRTERITFPSDAQTRDWSRRTARKVPHARRRFAEGTVPRDNEAIARHRRDVQAAVASRNGERIVVGYLGLAQALIDEHRLVGAARELEAAIAWVTRHELDVDSLWRLRLTLAAIYDGLGDRDAARAAALDARACAKDVASDLGRTRANAFLRRLDAAGNRHAASRP